jgi:hypothetical protein
MKNNSILVIGAFLLIASLAGCMGLSLPTCKYDNHGSSFPTVVTRTTQMRLAAIHNQADITGSFGGVVFVVGFGGGDISTQDTYSYYYYLPDGGLMRGKVSTTNSVIYEENRTDGELDTYTNYDCYCNEPCSPSYTPSRFEFHVPVGTVLKEFKLG